jgi:gliding motility-associated lipoprotein GldD
VKASDIQERLIINDSVNVYGLVYFLEGNAASSLQFYLTDSTNHFVRGALYFDAKPNPDSLAPVQNFIQEDILNMIESFRWK